jgi:hypothetical protein
MPFFAVRLAFESAVTQADTVVEAPDLPAALRMALEDYDWDVCETVSIDGVTFVEHCESFETEDEAEAFVARRDAGTLPIPLNMQSIEAIADAMLAALKQLADRVDDVTRAAGYGSGLFEPEMAGARAAIAAAEAAGVAA